MSESGKTDHEQFDYEISENEGGTMRERRIQRVAHNVVQPFYRAGLFQTHSRQPLIHLNLSNSTATSQGGNDNEKAREFLYSLDGDLREGTEKTKSVFSSASIYKVPYNLLELNRKAYTPQLITIGPLHQWGRGEYVKQHYANNLFLRIIEGKADEGKSNKKTEVLLECVKEMEMAVDDAKKCYATEYVDMDVKMMVVDGCFILELLYRYYELMRKEKTKPINGGNSGNSKAWSSTQQPQEGESEDTSKSSRRGQEMIDPIFDSISAENIIKQDLLLLENQIPFFVLEKLFKLTVEKIPNRPHKCSLTDYVLFYFRDTLNPEGNSTGECVLQVSGEGENLAGKPKQYYHILHLLHENYLPKQEPGPKAKHKAKFSEFTLSASNLEYAGVQFKPLSGNNLFNVKFIEDQGLSWWCRRASFAIPAIGIHEPTEPFLRNLIAFEQCCPGVSQHFTSYAFLMDMLINSEKDVQVLKDAKVIYNYLGADEDASNLFNTLCKGVFLDDFYFDDPCRRAFKYSEYGWPKILAYWKRTYFASPWAFIGFCLAFIAFGMSVTQFVYGFF